MQTAGGAVPPQTEATAAASQPQTEGAVPSQPQTGGAVLSQTQTGGAVLSQTQTEATGQSLFFCKRMITLDYRVIIGFTIICVINRHSRSFITSAKMSHSCRLIV